jgi:hypothetical protein
MRGGRYGFDQAKSRAESEQRRRLRVTFVSEAREAGQGRWRSSWKERWAHERPSAGRIALDKTA